jgi:UPF0271 protein
LSILINSDIGEGYPSDLDLYPLIDYANIACGGHAGNKNTIETAISLSLENNVSAGAHPSYPDVENFGRVSLLNDTRYNERGLIEAITEQLLEYSIISESYGKSSFHIKPHGSLYNDAMVNIKAADIVLESIKNLATDTGYPISNYPIMVQPNSALSNSAETLGYTIISEGFVDRGYKKAMNSILLIAPHLLI